MSFGVQLAKNLTRFTFWVIKLLGVLMEMLSPQLSAQAFYTPITNVIFFSPKARFIIAKTAIMDSQVE